MSSTSAQAASLSREDATALVKNVERVFGTGDVSQMMAGFTDDVVVRFADRPEMLGKGEVEAFLRARFARQKNYRLSKTLRIVSGNMAPPSPFM